MPSFLKWLIIMLSKTSRVKCQHCLDGSQFCSRDQIGWEKIGNWAKNSKLYLDSVKTVVHFRVLSVLISTHSYQLQFLILDRVNWQDVSRLHHLLLKVETLHILLFLSCPLLRRADGTARITICLCLVDGLKPSWSTYSYFLPTLSQGRSSTRERNKLSNERARDGQNTPQITLFERLFQSKSEVLEQSEDVSFFKIDRIIRFGPETLACMLSSGSRNCRTWGDILTQDFSATGEYTFATAWSWASTYIWDSSISSADYKIRALRVPNVLHWTLAK